MIPALGEQFVAAPAAGYWVAQGEFYARMIEARLDDAVRRGEAAHDRRLLTEAPEWVDGRHSPEDVQAARDAEHAAEVEVGKLTDKRDRMLAGLRSEQLPRPSSRRSAQTRPAVTRARRAPHPRERRCGGARRSSSSSSDDPSADSDDPEPAVGGPTARAPRSAP